MENKLSSNPSPYLQQHKNNPVNWQIWEKDVLDYAKKNKKPILLSIGYASCHWCHVMAHESFEDIQTAELMNNYFVNIKVDREERPDIDFIFQSSYQLFNQAGGGWPLTMFLDENAVPFMGGTYFPKEERHGLPSFKNLLKRVNDTYNEHREKILAQSDLIKRSLEIKKNPVLKQDFEPILNSIFENIDPNKGGYFGAPKFPVFNIYETFLYFYNKNKDEKYFQSIETFIKKICSGGIYDHVEGGISRYTVDENWLIPHFEKMLYDNAQFILLLAKFNKIKKDAYINKKIVQTLGFLNKNFKTSSGLFGSAYDADSEGEEGKYYTFNYDELKKIKDIENFFEINSGGNWEGKIILKEKKLAPDNIVEQLKSIRNLRKKPFFDNKTQLDLNCILISAFVKAHEILPKNEYLKSAKEIYQLIEKKFKNFQIYHSYSKDISFLEDYAYLISASLDLADATLEMSYRLNAKKLCEDVLKKFYIKEKKIFQKNQIFKNDIFCEPVDISDHTISNGNSIMLSNFSRLGMLEEAKELADSLNGYLNIYKNYMLSSLRAIDYFETISSGKKCNDEGCEI